MRKFSIIFCVLALIFSVSCENKVSVPANVISDSDADEISDEDADTVQEPLSDLKVEENEKNVLSCRLTFSTADEKKTFVKYYSPTHSGYKIGEETAKNEHYFFLWGMRENLDYTIEIYTDEETPELLATTEFHSGILPDFLHRPRLVTNEKELVQPGFVLFSQTTDSEDPNKIPLVLMVDNDGFVVWYYRHEFAGIAHLDDVQYIERTKTLFAGIHKYPSMADIPAEEGIEIDLEGNILWQSPDTTDYYYGEGSWHHEYDLLDNDTILFFRSNYQDDYLLFDTIVNVDRDYNELWIWSYPESPDYFGTVTCANTDDSWCDWTHTNSATLSIADHLLYFNSRNLGFFKMDMQSRQVLWKLGKNGDFTMLSEHQFPWPDSAHAPKFYDETRKRVLFYDNGLMERGLSRIIEYEIDEESKTAEITFEYNGLAEGKQWFGTAYGDADYLENGNILVTKGLVLRPDNSSIFEITRDGQVVWELYTEQNDIFMVLLYNSEKLIPPLEFLNE